jgi:hypothetical protein
MTSPADRIIRWRKLDDLNLAKGCDYAIRMAAGPRFVRFTSPFWFGMQGYFDEQDGTVVNFTDDGRQILVGVGEVGPDVLYVGVVHSGSVLPVSRFDDETQSVTVRLPEPWSEDQEGLPFEPDVVVAAESQDEPPRIEALTQTRAREMFPGEFDPLTQDELHRWAAEES